MHNAIIMLGFNWIDVIIVILLVIAILEGTRIGFLTQIFAISAFFGALFAAGWLFPHLLPLHDQTLRTIINTSLVLLTAIYAGFLGYDIGQNIHWSFRLGKLKPNRKSKAIEKYLGTLPSVLAGLVLVWLLGVGIGRLPFEGFSNSVSDSLIVQQLTRALPPVPAVFATFDKQVDPNSQPYIMSRPKPYAGFNYSALEVKSAESKAVNSVVRITSFGCGGLVSGSGFVVAPNLVMTNAHVIAGVKRPIIKYQTSSYEGVPVLFDSGLDLAILRAQKLGAPSLELSSKNAMADTTVAILGYPGGNYTAVPGLVRDDLNVAGRNIYDKGSFERHAYGIQAHTSKGSSGGPMVLKDGRVVGIIFSKATDTEDYAYALATSYMTKALRQAESSSQRVSTGACTVE